MWTEFNGVKFNTVKLLLFSSGVKMRLQKDQIVKTALEHLDRSGLEGMTLRRFAKELGVQAPAIYWHIANKETLLDEMANVILNQRFDAIDFADDQRDWAEWLRLMANDLRASMLAHRDGARVVAGAHLHVATTLLKIINLNIRVLHNAGFTYVEASRISTTVVTFTFGFTIEEQAPPPNVDFSELISVDDPTVADFLQALAEGGVQEFLPGDERFNACLSFIISGVRAELKPSG